jgi:hypothetical protein
MPRIRLVPRDRLTTAEVSWALFGLMLGATGALQAFLPAVAGRVIPACFLRTTLGVRCPTCGTGAALGELAAGHVGSALRLNWLAVTLAVALGIFELYLVGSLLSRRRLAVELSRPASMVLAGLGVTALVLAWIFQAR